MTTRIFLFSMVIIGCAHTKSTENKTIQAYPVIKKDLNTYKVYKIDSINSWYLIYAKKKDTLFKIVSKKESISDCERIQLNSEYRFSLTSIWFKKMLIGNVDVSPGTTLHINCVSFDKSTLICVERDSINDLHAASNVKGLCFMKE